MSAVLIVALLLYGNGAALVFAGDLPGGGWLAAALGIGLTGAVLLWARRTGLTPGELGLVPRRALRAALLGAAVGVPAALAGLVILRDPPLVGGPVSYAPAAGIEPLALAAHALFFLPLAVIVPEEVAFRGALLAALRRHVTLARAALASAVLFAAWHAVIVLATIERSSLQGDALYAGIGIAGAFAAVFAGGVAFAALRWWTGSLAAPIAAHWGFNVALLVGLRFS